MKTNKAPIKPITLKNKESDYIIKFNFYLSNLFYSDKNIYYNKEKIFTLDEFNDYFDFLNFIQKSNSESEIFERIMQMINSELQTLNIEISKNNQKINDYNILEKESFNFINVSKFPSIEKHLEDAEVYEIIGK